MTQEFGDVFDIMYNRVRMGQLFSLDKAYSTVRSSAECVGLMANSTVRALACPCHDTAWLHGGYA